MPTRSQAEEIKKAAVEECTKAFDARMSVLEKQVKLQPQPNPNPTSTPNPNPNTKQKPI